MNAGQYLNVEKETKERDAVARAIELSHEFLHTNEKGLIGGD